MLLRRFRDDSSGSVALIFGLSLLVLIGAAGMAIDYARAVDARTRLQAAVDAAALALAHADRDLTQAELEAKAASTLAQNFSAGADILDSTLEVERGKDFITVNSTAEMKTTLMNVLGIKSTDISAEGQAVWGSTRLEVVLVLDNSTSMAGNNRLKELKKASKELIDILEEASFEPGAVKIGLVPFARGVRVKASKYKNAGWVGADWINFAGVTVCEREDGKKVCKKQPAVTKDTWTGCLTDRDKDYDVTDGGYDVGNVATLYPAVQKCPTTHYSETDLKEIEPLNENFGDMKTAIEGMTAGGLTNLTIGISLGSALLSHVAPFEEGVDPATQPEDEKTEKIIIALTDGDNTKNRFTAYNSGGDADIDARNELACENAKSAGIRIYTVLLISGNGSLLKKCASSTNNYTKVSDAADLLATFRTIGAEITKLRLGK